MSNFCHKVYPVILSGRFKQGYIKYGDGRIHLGKVLQLKDPCTGRLNSTQLYGGREAEAEARLKLLKWGTW